MSVPLTRKERFAAFTPLLAAAVTFLVFLPSLKNGFVNWDDLQNIVENQNYRGLGWRQLKWMFTTFHLGPYQPLSWLTYGADYLAWGMDPFGYHLTNVVLHSANAALFCVLCLKLYLLSCPPADRESRTEHYLAAGCAALFFALHPLRVESVAWVTERRDVLSGFFYLLTLLWYIPPRAAGGERAGAWRRHLLPLATFLCALLSKGIAITLPAALILLDIFALKRLSPDIRRWFSAQARPVWPEKIPYFILAAVFGAAGYIGQAGSGAVASYQTFGFSARAAQVFFSAGLYLAKTILPLGLVPEYKLAGGLAGWQPALGAGALAALTAAAVALGRRSPAFLGAWLFYLITLSPVSGIVKLGSQSAADRYTYLPCLGFALLAGGALLAARRAGQRAGKTGALLACLALAGLGGLAWRQQGYWRDSETLWRHALEVNPDLAFAHYNLGVFQAAQGRLDEAADHYRAAVRSNPVFAQGYYSLGRIMAAQGKPGAAQEHYRAALKLDPYYALAHYNLGLVLDAQQRRGEAAEHYRAALAGNPGLEDAHYRLAGILARQGDGDQAAEHYLSALKLNPDRAETHYNLGVVLAARGSADAAEEQYRAALRLDPGSALAHYNLGGLLLKRGKTGEAEEHYRAALKLAPGFAAARNNLSVILSGKGR
ncbi:MAG TPA: tetratricopeptide repeat protein [Elusimicrobiales bacterium]|nr:tetratricopeptide repeat protein [Elusimicrobiales bacterium]